MNKDRHKSTKVKKKKKKTEVDLLNLQPAKNYYDCRGSSDDAKRSPISDKIGDSRQSDQRQRPAIPQRSSHKTSVPNTHKFRNQDKQRHSTPT